MKEITEKPGRSTTEEGHPKGLVVAGLSGGSGKSVVSVGLVSALVSEGHRVVPFKKGPDYIDAGWLTLAAGVPCKNLDPYLMSEEVIRDSYYRGIGDTDYIVVEGNRGLFDGVDLKGSFSTAELAVFLDLPVLLVVDCTKATRTIAALVKGCVDFDRRVNICGVVLNRVGTGRHESVIREAVEYYTEVPVIGSIARSKVDVFPQRHLGVTPGPEHKGSDEALEVLAGRIGSSLDLEKLKRFMGLVEPLVLADGKEREKHVPVVRIGVIRDAAFQFYYQENLDALVGEGAKLVEINALTARELPEIDALYIGGGFPETSARELAANKSFLASVKEKAGSGLPVYAECGGLIYLGRNLEVDGQNYKLADVFPVSFSLHKKPQAHGYTRLRVLSENPFYEVGTEISGHEFRYSKVDLWPEDSEILALKMDRGVGFADGRDGLVYKNVLAMYTHVHALGTPQWASGLTGAAERYRRDQAWG